jgi:acetolactate synthase-1/2/3 large subunit
VSRTASTADIIVQSLISHGVDTVFGIPGVQTYPLFDAMARSGLRVIGARHEQTVAYMAFGYAQATGRTGVYSVVPGPGFLNSSAALISAYGASAPVVCITGEIPSAFIGRGLGHLHELPDQLATMRSLTKWAAIVEHPSQANELTAQAFYHARSGRPRPTAIAVPRNVLAAPVPSGSLPVNAEPPVPLHPPELDRGAIAAAAGLLAGASNPMIMVGSSGPPRSRRPASSATSAPTWTTWRPSGPRCPPTVSSWKRSARPDSSRTSGSRCTRRASSSPAATRARSGSATPPRSA